MKKNKKNNYEDFVLVGTAEQGGYKCPKCGHVNNAYVYGKTCPNCGYGRKEANKMISAERRYEKGKR